MLRRYHFPFALLATALTSIGASAGEIVFETRATTSAVMPWDGLSSWQAQTSAIRSTQLDSFTEIFTPGPRRHSHLQLQFDSGAMTPWEFEFGLDAGLGASLYLNGVAQSATTEDLWWGYDWKATDELLRLASTVFMRPSNTIDLYWAENCCAGGQSGRFRRGNGPWQALSTANLKQVAVAEPGTLALLSVGLVGFAAGNRRRRKSD